MNNNFTLTIIKPNVTKKNVIGEVIQRIEEGGFEIHDAKMMTLTVEQAQQFYSEHSEKSFYDKLIQFMTSGRIVAMKLKKENAVTTFRNFIGSTNPNEAEKETIRSIYGESVTENAIHGSDSDESAQKEINFFFGSLE